MLLLTVILFLYVAGTAFLLEGIIMGSPSALVVGIMLWLGLLVMTHIKD